MNRAKVAGRRDVRAGHTRRLRWCSHQYDVDVPEHLAESRPGARRSPTAQLAGSLAFPDSSCRCLVSIAIESNTQEACTATANTVPTASGRTYDCCVSGGRLSTLAGNAELVPAAELVTPEICDGLDNDGTPDNHLSDTPCRALQGVCTDGVTATCHGAAGWSCD
jgi:hypothetical protein